MWLEIRFFLAYRGEERYLAISYAQQVRGKYFNTFNRKASIRMYGVPFRKLSYQR